MAETNTQTNTTTQTTAPAQTTQNAQETAPAPTEGNDTPKQEITPQSAAQQPEKTFTQDELNKIISDRLKSERDRWEKKAADEKAEAERVANVTADDVQIFRAKFRKLIKFFGNKNFHIYYCITKRLFFK